MKMVSEFFLFCFMKMIKVFEHGDEDKEGKEKR
jgi:hypothetical protein